MNTEDLKKTLESEVRLLNGKLRKLAQRRLDKGTELYGQVWTAIFTGQIESYERILKTLEGKDGHSRTPD